MAMSFSNFICENNPGASVRGMKGALHHGMVKWHGK